FSPLRDPRSPVEILQAQVESNEFLMWQDRAVPVNLVVYRADSGSALSSTRQPRVKLWVGDDGAVLKQEVSMLNSKIQFTRMSQERSEKYGHLSESSEGEWVLRHPRPIGSPLSGLPDGAPPGTEEIAAPVPRN